MNFRDDIHVEISSAVPDEDAVESPAPRRDVGMRITAALVLLALVGGLYLRPHGDVTMLSARGPAPTPAGLQALARDALVTVGVYAPEFADELPGVWSETVVYAPVEHIFGDIDAGPFPAGTYNFMAACSGKGTASLLWEAPGAEPGAQRGNLTVPCGHGVGSGSSVVLTEAGQIHVAVHGDDDSAGRAAFAIRFTDPRSVAASAALGPSDETTLFQIDGETSSSMTYAFEATPAGRYRLSLVCVGTATIRVGLTAGSFTEQSLACQPSGARIELEVGSAEGLRQVTVAVTLGDGPPGQAGWAFRVDRVG